MGLARWIRSRAWGLAIGTIVTSCVTIGFGAGLLARLDHYGLDLHIRYAHHIDVDERIVLIDIDDTSLEMASFPWPRRQFARLVQTLAYGGAESIVLDVVFADPSRLRVEHADLGRRYDLDQVEPARGSRAWDEVIDDDGELHDAMESAGNVYLAMYARLAPVSVDPAALVSRGIELIGTSPAISSDELQRQLDVPPLLSENLALPRLHAARALAGSYGLEVEEAIQKILPEAAVTEEDIRRVWASAKRLAARRHAEQFLHNNTEASWSAFFGAVLPNAKIADETPDRQMLADALRRERARTHVVPRLNSLFGRGLTGVPRAYDETFPSDMLAQAARGVGFVAYAPETGGGIVRSLPLLIGGSETMYPQLGFLVACDALGLAADGGASEPGELVLTGREAPRVVPVEADGETIVAWHVPDAPVDWRRSFTHIPAHEVLRAATTFEAIEKNERRIGLALAELVERRHRETSAEYARYEELVNRRWPLERASLRAFDGIEPSAVSEDRAQLDAAIAALEQDALAWLERSWQLWREAVPETAAERRERADIARLHRELVEERYVERLGELNRRLRAEAVASLKEVRARVGGRICLVGYTASSVADLVTTPIYPSMPGVMAHANILNMMLGNQFVWIGPLSLQVVVLVVSGLITTSVTCRFGPVPSLALVGLLGVVVAVLGVLVFRQAHVHLATMPMVAAIAGVWAPVTVYRQVTEERARRQFQRALSQYTSPSIASQIARETDVGRLAPQPAEVTCFFSDLAGFTPLSERLGPGRTRDVLNPYLERTSSILVERGAIVNKFIGDGVFAFFNAPIRACVEHEAAACEAAIACRNALAAINEELTELCEPLVMRIGVATGEVFVGDYGSATKLDYTCIGDRVNVASRLEQANKVFGSTILIDAATRQALGEGWGARPVGRLRVAGRSEAVEAFALLGHLGDLDDVDRLSIDLSSRAIHHFQACEWGLCRALLLQLQEDRRGDPLARLYLRAVSQFESKSPAPDWDGAIHVTAS